jgi:hypothetical protein
MTQHVNRVAGSLDCVLEGFHAHDIKVLQAANNDQGNMFAESGWAYQPWWRTIYERQRSIFRLQGKSGPE